MPQGYLRSKRRPAVPELLTRVTVIADEGARHDCKLVAFGGIICGFCDRHFNGGKLHVGERHTCGASVLEIVTSAGKAQSVHVGPEP
jgi:hypothetical protein